MRPSKSVMQVTGFRTGVGVRPNSAVLTSLLFTLFLSAAALAYPQQGNEPTNELLSHAKQAELARDFPRAAECYTSFLKEHSDRADIWQRLGLAYYLGA